MKLQLPRPEVADFLRSPDHRPQGDARGISWTGEYGARRPPMSDGCRTQEGNDFLIYRID